MIGHLAQEVAHMHVIEVDPEDAVFRHYPIPPALELPTLVPC
jgi:hypothetical protein